MSTRRNYLLVLSLIVVTSLFYSTFLWTYPWPVSDFNVPHPISGTLGEWRDTPYLHIHEGVDIAETGVLVYPVTDGMIYRSDIGADYVKVGGGKYMHITPNQEIKNWFILHPDEGYPAKTSETILGIISGSHLHFEENGGASNPLLGLDNFSDTASPAVNWIKVVKQGTGQEFPTTAFAEISPSGRFEIE